MTNASDPVAPRGSSGSQTQQLLARLERLPMSPWHLVFYIIMILAAVGDNSDATLINTVNAKLVDEWHITLVQVGFIVSAGSLGAVAGATLFGWLGDLLGRRAAFAWAVLTFSALTALTAFAQDVNQVIVARALTGLGLGGLYPITMTYIAEFAPGAWRGKLVAWSNLSVSISTLVAPLIGLYVIVPFGWRPGLLVFALPAVFVIVAFLGWIPESVPWLIQKGKTAEAEATVASVEKAVLRGRTLPAPETSASAPAGMEPTDAAPTAHQPMSQVLRSLMRPGYRGAVLSLIPIWSLPWLFALTAFYVVLLPNRLGLSLSEVLQATALAAFGGFAGNAVGGFCSDWLGRKRTLYVGLVPWVVGPWGMFYLANSVATLTIYLALANFGLFMYASGVFAYSPEQLPAAVRSTGLGVLWSIFRATQTVAPLLGGAIIQFSGDVWVMLIGNTAASLVTLAIIWAFGKERRDPLSAAGAVLPVAQPQPFEAA